MGIFFSFSPEELHRALCKCCYIKGVGMIKWAELIPEIPAQ